jgi:hypothetical protein
LSHEYRFAAWQSVVEVFYLIGKLTERQLVSVQLVSVQTVSVQLVSVQTCQRTNLSAYKLVKSLFVIFGSIFDSGR